MDTEAEKKLILPKLERGKTRKYNQTLYAHMNKRKKNSTSL
jgi:hypothetical protein